MKKLQRIAVVLFLPFLTVHASAKEEQTQAQIEQKMKDNEADADIVKGMSEEQKKTIISLILVRHENLTQEIKNLIISEKEKYGLSDKKMVAVFKAKDKDILEKISRLTEEEKSFIGNIIQLAMWEGL